MKRLHFLRFLQAFTQHKIQQRGSRLIRYVSQQVEIFDGKRLIADAVVQGNDADKTIACSQGETPADLYVFKKIITQLCVSCGGFVQGIVKVFRQILLAINPDEPVDPRFGGLKCSRRIFRESRRTAETEPILPVIVQPD